MSETFFQVVESGDFRKVFHFLSGGDPTAPFLPNLDVNEVNADGYSLLHWTIKRVNPVRPCTDMCTLLLSMGANPNTCEYVNGNSPLHDVCDPATAAILIQSGADPTRLNKFGLMPVEVVTGRFDGFTEKYLAGFTPNYVSRGARSLWHAGNDINFLQQILQNGGVNGTPLDPNLRDETGLTPLHFNVRRGGRCNAIRLLVQFGASLEVSDTLGNTPLHDVSDLETLSTLMEIIAQNDNAPDYPFLSSLLSKRNISGLTPLETAMQDDTKWDIVNYLKDIISRLSFHPHIQMGESIANVHSKKRSQQDDDNEIEEDYVDGNSNNFVLKRSNTLPKRQRKVALNS